jgi:hypothetical protein
MRTHPYFPVFALHYCLQAASVHARRVTIFFLRLFHVVIFVICAILAAVVSAQVRTTGYYITSAYSLDATEAVGTNRYKNVNCMIAIASQESARCIANI